MKIRRTRSLLLIAAVLHGLVYMLLLPPWMGEDEPWHVEYAHHLSTGHLSTGEDLSLRSSNRRDCRTPADPSEYKHFLRKSRHSGLSNGGGSKPQVLQPPRLPDPS